MSLPLVSFAFLKRWTGDEYIADDSPNRPRAEEAIAVASRMVTDCIRVPIVRGEQTRVFDWRHGTSSILLSAWPVAEVAEVRFAAFGDFEDEESVLIYRDEYVWTRGGRIGFRYPAPVDVPQSVRVTWTAGLVDDLADIEAVDGDGIATSEYHYIATATAMQAAHILKRHDNLAGTTETTGAASFGFQGPVRLLPLVKDMLKPLSDWQAG